MERFRAENLLVSTPVPPSVLGVEYEIMLCGDFFETLGRKRYAGIQGARRIQRIVFVAGQEHADGAALDFVQPVPRARRHDEPNAEGHHAFGQGAG
jgi:hypothetical protein